ncbi:MAG TPA: amidohydrolase [Microlunatus sp.]
MSVGSAETDRPALIAAETDRLFGRLVELRRDLHAHPEIGNQEFRTTQLIVDTLGEAGLTAKVLDIGTGAVCDLLPDDYDPASGLVGLRGDIDGLPIQDGKTVPYRSRLDGFCHACGHDVHTTVVLGAGLVLARLRERGHLHRGVRLIFQPAEELSPGGAVDAIACGAIDGLSEVYAMHCDPRTDAGRLALKTGAITSAVDRVLVTVRGPGGHTSRPQLSGDLIGALGAVATTAQLVLSRRVDPRSGVSLMWGKIAAGSVANAIPGVGTIEGTLRALDESGWQLAQQLIPELVRQIVSPFSVEVDVDVTKGVPPAVNHAIGVEHFSRAVRTMLGSSALTRTEQSLGGEDFAWMLQQVPGAMARLGVRPAGAAVAPDIHQPTFDVDERCISVGVKVLCELAAGRRS